MIIDCPTCKERKVIVPDKPDGCSHICKKCYAALMNKLLLLIKPAPTPHLTIAKGPTIKTESVA